MERRDEKDAWVRQVRWNVFSKLKQDRLPTCSCAELTEMLEYTSQIAA